jgi:AcrR family transcriptional regulator
MKTENKILDSARKIILLYGYHGTTIEKIARDAGVSKAIIHYYFRTKDNLYREIVRMIADSILQYKDFEYPDAHLTWFLVSELRNNKTMFMKIIDNKMGKGWNQNIQKLIKRSMEIHSPAEFSEKK